MNKSRALILSFFFFCGSGVWADDVAQSTQPLAVADTGETISTPTPHAMTDSPIPTFWTETKTLAPESRRPPNTDVFYPEDVRTFDAQNLGESLLHRPGILMQERGAAGYPLSAQIRGASAGQTLVLMDGRPVEGAMLGAADLSEIPLEQIDHVEIVRGGLSSLYGPNAVAGVINVVSKRATKTGYPQSHVGFEDGGSDRQAYKLDFGSRQGALDYFFFGDQQRERGFRPNSDAGRYNIGANAGLSMKEKGKIIVDGGSFHANAGLPGAENPANTLFARRVTDSSYLRASYLVDLPLDMFLAARVYGHERETDLDDSADSNPASALSTDRREHSKGGDFQLNLPLGLLAGASFIHDQEDLEDRLAPANSFSGRAENWGLFAQETLHWESFTLIPSGRYDKNSQFGGTANPRVQGTVDATDWLSFSASAGRSFRAPTFDEARFNRDLNPEKAWTYEAGFVTHESSRTVRVKYFRAHVGDEIQASSFTASNVQSARRQGVEIQIDHTVNAYFRDGWNYTYLENLGVPSGFTRRVALAESPRHAVNFYAVITPSKKWEIDPVMRYESARFSGNDQTGAKMGSQVIMDLRIAYQWRQLELYFGMKDLLDKRYAEQSGYPLPGRTAYGGVRLRLWG